MPAHQRADAGAVGGWHAAQIDHEPLVAEFEDVLDPFFQLLGRTSGDQRFLRRQEQPILVAFRGCWRHRARWRNGTTYGKAGQRPMRMNWIGGAAAVALLLFLAACSSSPSAPTGGGGGRNGGAAGSAG